MTLIRVLIPTWRFFDRLGRVPELLYRVKAGGELSSWESVLQKPKIGFWNLFLNPECNLYFAYQSLIDRLLDDSQTQGDSFESQVSFELVKNLVHEKVKKHPGATHFEFKVNITEYENSTSKKTEVFQTPEYKV